MRKVGPTMSLENEVQYVSNALPMTTASAISCVVSERISWSTPPSEVQMQQEQYGIHMQMRRTVRRAERFRVRLRDGIAEGAGAIESSLLDIVAYDNLPRALVTPRNVAQLELERAGLRQFRTAQKSCVSSSGVVTGTFLERNMQTNQQQTPCSHAPKYRTGDRTYHNNE